jgi:hypothetical protein
MLAQMDKQEIINQIKIMAMAYPLKAMANELDKPYSTLSNELDEREWAKLGFRTVLSMLERSFSPSAPEQSRTAGLMVLDMIEAAFGRVAYNIPRSTENPTDLMRLISSLSIEYAQDIEHLACAFDDGKWTKHEISRCRKENRDLLRSCLKIEAYLDRVASTPETSQVETE